jgi:hypothetical protein
VRPSQQSITGADHLLWIINVAGLAWSALDAWMEWGPWSAYACVGITSVLYIAHVQWRKHSVLTQLLVFGIGAGLAELAADWWLVSVTRTLHYAQWGPFLIDSPSYMPLSWAGILLSMGWLGWVVQRRFGMLAGMAAATVVTGVYVPVFEGLAHYAGWWTYSDCRMWGPVPWYIIIGEALVGLSLTPLVKHVLAGSGIKVAFVSGLGAGLWIWAAYAVGMWLT